MANESSKETSEGHVESLIDELIGEIFRESGASAESSKTGMAATAALLESAFGSSRKGSRTSMLERLFLAQAFATELADVLAPALAEQLAPRLLKALEELMKETGDKKPPPPARSSSQSRKPEGR
jgi:hypothetical protein